MSGNAFKRVQPGEALQIPAKAYNAMLDRVEGVRPGMRQSLMQQFRRASLVRVYNNGTDLAQFQGARINPTSFLPSVGSDVFREYKGIPEAANADTYPGSIVIAAEPIPQSTIGLAWAAGICVTKVDTSINGTFDFIAPDGNAIMRCVPWSGCKRISGDQSQSAEQWWLVRLGSFEAVQEYEFAQSGYGSGPEDDLWHPVDRAGNLREPGVWLSGTPYALSPKQFHSVHVHISHELTGYGGPEYHVLFDATVLPSIISGETSQEVGPGGTTTLFTGGSYPPTAMSPPNASTAGLAADPAEDFSVRNWTPHTIPAGEEVICVRSPSDTQRWAIIASKAGSH